MSVLWYKIGVSGILGSLSLMGVWAGIYIIENADDWMERLFGAFVILSSILVGFFIACLWSVGRRGLE